MSEATIEVMRRPDTGKNNNRRVRVAGGVPAVVYGGGLDSLAVAVDRRTVEKVLRSSGENTVFMLTLQGSDQSRHAMIRDIQLEATTGKLMHIDFQRILMDVRIKVHVPVELVGIPLGVKNEGGMVDFVTREIEIECLPSEIPKQLVLDISELHVGQHVEASALTLPPGAILIDEPDRTVVSLSISRLALADEATEEEGKLVEAAADEPVVIGRAKDEE